MMRALVAMVCVALHGCGGASGADAGAGGGLAGGSVTGGGATSGGSAGGGSAGGGSTSGGSAGGGSAGGGSAGGGSTGGGSAAGGAPSGGSAGGGATAGGRLLAFVGSGNGTISVFSVDSTDAGLTLLGTTSGGSNPSFLAIDAPRGRLYAVNEGSSQVAAFELRPDAGLALLNRVVSQGAGPAHVSVDPSGRWVLVANYSGGNVAVLPVRPGDGGLGPAVDVEASGGQAHQIVTDGRAAWVPCKAADHVAQYRFDADAGQLTALSPAVIRTATGAGPRHLALHPSGRWAFLINELDDTMTSLRLEADGRLSAVDTKSTLPAGFMGANTCAEVAVHPNGRFVFGSNRGHDSIVSFAFDDTSGALTLVGHAPTGGQTPRHFELDPAGRFLLVGNQNSNSVHALRIEATGALTPLGQRATVNSPAFVGFSVLP